MRAINLLPPEAFERAKARRRIQLWIFLGILYLGLLAAATFWWQGRVDDRKDELAVEQETVTRLQAEVAGLAEFAALKAEFDNSVLILATALDNDVVWGRLLNDLGRMIPDRVWIDSFAGTVNPASGAVGEIQVSGTAFDYPDVAAWLRALDSTTFSSVESAWVTNITQGSVGEIPVVRFSSSTFITEGALSDRLALRIPEIS
jgi:type IV pilus assembly protein PilN